MSNFVSREQREEVARWFRSVCKVTVGDVTRDFPEVLALDHLTPVGEVLAVLEDVQIQSVVVFGAAHSFIGAGGVEVISDGKQYIGIVSIIDILAFSLKNDNFLNHRISDVIGSTNESLTLWCEDAHQPLYYALEQFIKGVHHALVRDSKDSSVPLKYLAQIDILRHLLSDTTSLPHLELMLVQPVEIVSTKNVVPVYLNTPLLHAVSLLVEHSALPVVNEAGVVVSNLSASDFKGKSTAELRSLPDATVQNLLQHQAVDLMQLHPPITISSSACLFDAARHMILHHVHRLWVVPTDPSSSNDSTPPNDRVLFEGLGVLTLTDILRAVYMSEQ